MSDMIKSKKYDGVYKRAIQKREMDKSKKVDHTIYITYKDTSSKKVWEKVGKESEGYNETYAHKLRNERIQQIRHGESVVKKQYTLNNLFDNYYYPHAAKRLKYAKTDKDRYNKFIRENIGNLNIKHINVKVIQEFKQKLEKEGLATATINHYLKIIRQIINYTNGLELHNIKSPFRGGALDAGVSLDNPQNNRERFLSKKEINKLLSKLKDRHIVLYRMSLISVYTGLRRGEIFDLRLSNIDHKNKRIVLNPSQTKSGKPRSVTLKEQVYEEIIKQIEDRSIKNNDDLLFVTCHGNKYSKIERPFNKAVDELNLNDNIESNKDKVTFHTLRHSFASHMAMLGTPIVTLQHLLGHSTIDMTMRYSHLIPDHSDKYINQLPY